MSWNIGAVAEKSTTEKRRRKEKKSVVVCDCLTIARQTLRRDRVPRVFRNKNSKSRSWTAREQPAARRINDIAASRLNERSSAVRSTPRVRATGSRPADRHEEGSFVRGKR
ncbi:hypothetical protein PUN28_017114 [Cardiocondyla obscurior]|uniref:Uncharacterized protein n=1 Tax=Cardiocondyla obscurior TaxID=286306 RepID=A0AAW2EPM4_9HYME